MTETVMKSSHSSFFSILRQFQSRRGLGLGLNLKMRWWRPCISFLGESSGAILFCYSDNRKTLINVSLQHEDIPVRALVTHLVNKGLRGDHDICFCFSFRCLVLLFYTSACFMYFILFFKYLLSLLHLKQHPKTNLLNSSGWNSWEGNQCCKYAEWPQELRRKWEK